MSLKVLVESFSRVLVVLLLLIEKIEVLGLETLVLLLLIKSILIIEELVEGS